MRVATQNGRCLAGQPRVMEPLVNQIFHTFVALAGIYDPPRATVKEAVAKCRAAGIRLVTLPLQSGRRPRRMPLLFPITPCFTARAGKLPTARSYS